MDLAAILAGIGGAASGAAQGFSWEQEQKNARQKLKDDRAAVQARAQSQEEIARLRAEVQEMVARIAGGSRETVAATNAGARTEAATIGADARVESATIGANSREKVAGTTATNRLDVERLRQGGADRRHVNPSGNVLSIISGQNQRHATPSGDATLGAETARRGQLFTAETARRGQDMTQQNTQFSAAEATKRAQLRARDPWAESEGFAEATTAEPGALPVTAPVTPPASTPRVQPKAPDATQDQMTALEAAATSVLQQYRSATTADKKAAYKKELDRLKAERQKLLTKQSQQ